MQTDTQNSSRRSFLRGSVAAGLTVAGASMLLGSPARADVAKAPTPGDIAVLKFLAAAELVEQDLWQQYTELSAGNQGFIDALSNIDPAIPRYAHDTRNDERSHAEFINAYLMSLGEQPINLDAFRTIPPVNVTGSNTKEKRLTNLRHLTVDTSWFNRYRSHHSLEFGATFVQEVNIKGYPTVPLSDNLTTEAYQIIANTAAFHFCAIEQGGSSLYTTLTGNVTYSDVLRILVSIGPTEVFHYATFEGSLENLPGLNNGHGLIFPDLRNDPDVAQGVLPKPTQFLHAGLPNCSVIRPSSVEFSGALAAATGLVKSNLFDGQSQEFFNAVVSLAQAADAAVRGL